MNWLYQFLAGRHGPDQLTLALFVLSMALTLIGRLFFYPLTLLAILLIALCLFRILSRNHVRRNAENAKFLQIWNGARGWFDRQKQRHAEHKYYKHFTCPNCGQKLRVPRGKGKIRITCAKCQTKFERKT